MEKVGKVRLGMNSEMTVLVESDVMMKNSDDRDDLYFIMFNVMADPLRLSIITIGDLIALAKANTEKSETELLKLLEDDPEQYVFLALGNTELLMDKSVEKIKIPLDSQPNADKARVIISSMIDKSKFIQKSNYMVGGESVVKEQEVDTSNMIPQLKLMLEIIKRWESIDLEELEQMLGNE